jgi:hypothetical protein
MSPPLEGFENSAQSMMGSWREGGPVPRSKQQPAEASMQQPADVRTDFTCAQRRESLAFLSDDVIARHPVYRALQGLACGVAHALHGFSVEGWKQVPKQKGVMLVSLHTTHSGDIGPCMLYGQKLSGRVVRGLLHRLLMATAPILRYIGGVPGYRDTAYELLRAGNWVAVVPGGAEEIMAHNSANGQLPGSPSQASSALDSLKSRSRWARASKSSRASARTGRCVSAAAGSTRFV